MAKPEWGRKRTCQVCGKKYYDLNKSPIICPCPEAIEFDPNDPVDFVIIKSYRPDDSTKNPDYYITGIENDNYYPIIMNDLRGPPGPKGLHGMY